MAHTNSTTHYHYPQFIGTDKPGWLTDINNAFSGIDGDIYSAQTKADDVYTLASTAETKADNAQTTANTAVTNAGTANTNIGTMANLETTEKSTLVGAVNEVKGNVDSQFSKFFNMASSQPTVTLSQSSLVSNELYVAKNADSSLFKFYGRLVINGVNNSNGITATVNAGLTGVTSDYTINGMIRFIQANGVLSPQPGSFTVKQNGNIEISFATSSAVTRYDFYFQPCIYVNKDFGDN